MNNQQLFLKIKADSNVMLFYKYLSPKVKSGWTPAVKEEMIELMFSTVHRYGVPSQLPVFIDFKKSKKQNI